jgi:hypothetical protein
MDYPIPFYFEGISADSWQIYPINQTKFLIIENLSGSNSLQFSFDGINRHGIVNPNDFFAMEECLQYTVYIKTYIAGATANFRVSAWGRLSYDT